MTDPIQVNEGEGMTPELCLHQIATLMMQTYPDRFDESHREWLEFRLGEDIFEHLAERDDEIANVGVVCPQCFTTMTNGICEKCKINVDQTTGDITPLMQCPMCKGSGKGPLAQCSMCKGLRFIVDRSKQVNDRMVGPIQSGQELKPADEKVQIDYLEAMRDLNRTGPSHTEGFSDD